MENNKKSPIEFNKQKEKANEYFIEVKYDESAINAVKPRKIIIKK